MSILCYMYYFKRYIESLKAAYSYQIGPAKADDEPIGLCAE